MAAATLPVAAEACRRHVVQLRTVFGIELKDFKKWPEVHTQLCRLIATLFKCA